MGLTCESRFYSHYCNSQVQKSSKVFLDLTNTIEPEYKYETQGEVFKIGNTFSL